MLTCLFLSIRSRGAPRLLSTWRGRCNEPFDITTGPHCRHLRLHLAELLLSGLHPCLQHEQSLLGGEMTDIRCCRRRGNGRTVHIGSRLRLRRTAGHTIRHGALMVLSIIFNTVYNNQKDYMGVSRVVQEKEEYIVIHGG